MNCTAQHRLFLHASNRQDEMPDNATSYFKVGCGQTLFAYMWVIAHRQYDELGWRFVADGCLTCLIAAIRTVGEQSSKPILLNVLAHDRKAQRILSNLPAEHIYNNGVNQYYWLNLTGMSMASLKHVLVMLQQKEQASKQQQFQRRVPFGDLITERDVNAEQYGCGEGTTCYDSAIIIGDVKIGSHVWIGPNVVLDGSGGLQIGDYVSISAGVHIYTHDSVAWATSRGKASIEYAGVTIGSGVYIGPNAILQKGISVADGAVIGAMAFVNKDVPANATARGVPVDIYPR